MINPTSKKLNEAEKENVLNDDTLEDLEKESLIELLQGALDATNGYTEKEKIQKMSEGSEHMCRMLVKLYRKQKDFEISQEHMEKAQERLEIKLKELTEEERVAAEDIKKQLSSISASIEKRKGEDSFKKILNYKWMYRNLPIILLIIIFLMIASNMGFSENIIMKFLSIFI